MLDKEKIIIACYVNVSGLETSTIRDLIDNFSKTFDETFTDGSVITLIFPIENGETRLECHNLEHCSNEQIDTLNKNIEDIKKELKKWK